MKYIGVHLICLLTDTTWMNLKHHTEWKKPYLKEYICMIPFIWNVRKNNTNRQWKIIKRGLPPGEEVRVELAWVDRNTLYLDKGYISQMYASYQIPKQLDWKCARYCFLYMGLVKWVLWSYCDLDILNTFYVLIQS